MNRIVLLVALLAFSSATAAPSTISDLEFVPPGRAAGNISGENFHWALLVFADQHGANASASFPNESLHENFRQVATEIDDGASTNHQFDVPVPSLSQSLPPFALELGFGGRGTSSIYVEAENLSWSIESTDAALRPYDGCLRNAVGMETVHEAAARYDWLCMPLSAAVLANQNASGVGLNLRGIGVSVVEWHNAASACSGLEPGSCPDGGAREIERTDVGSAFIERKVRGYNRLSSSQGMLNVSGFGAIAIMGGSNPDVSVDGLLRLPVSTATPPCETCMAPEGQTLTLGGTSRLRGLEVSGKAMKAELEGEFSSARFDETSIDPSLITGTAAAAAAVATAGAAFLLKFLLAPFFTRLTKAEALEHPRRKAIFEHIQRNPGTSFRETARTVGIAAGTVRHHLNVLERAGMVVERPHGATVRFFEQKDSDADWVSVVMLREPALKVLHDWLKLHPGSPQTGILEAMEEQGWSRSTTQHRLLRLVDSGLVAIKLQGRYKMYRVVERQGEVVPAIRTVAASSGSV